MATGNESKPFDSVTASHSETNYTYAYVTDGSGSELQHVLLTGRTRRDIGTDNSVLGSR